MEIDVTAPPHVLGQIDYHQGAWSDGGTISTYHGKSPALEWQEFDFSNQPCDYAFANAETKKVFGVEHHARVKTTKPDGTVSMGRAHFSLFLNGRYSPYGSEGGATGPLSGRGLA